eukprot:6519645-Prymnesium_polylepis.1
MEKARDESFFLLSPVLRKRLAERLHELAVPLSLQPQRVDSIACCQDGLSLGIYTLHDGEADGLVVRVDAVAQLLAFFLRSNCIEALLFESFLGAPIPALHDLLSDYLALLRRNGGEIDAYHLSHAAYDIFDLDGLVCRAVSKLCLQLLDSPLGIGYCQGGRSGRCGDACGGGGDDDGG